MSEPLRVLGMPVLVLPIPKGEIWFGRTRRIRLENATLTLTVDVEAKIVGVQP